MVMFRVTKKPGTPNIVWDASKGRRLCRFVHGVFETGDETVANRLKNMGHTVEKITEENSLDEMKADGLRAYAAEHNIDLGDAKSKADILKIIQEAGTRE